MIYVWNPVSMESFATSFSEPFDVKSFTVDSFVMPEVGTHVTIDGKLHRVVAIEGNSMIIRPLPHQSRAERRHPVQPSVIPKPFYQRGRF